MACFNVQYCTLYVVLIGKLSVMNLRLCRIGILNFFRDLED